MSRETKLVKNSLILAVGTVFSKIATILILSICTNWLSQTDYGNYDLIVTIVSMLLPLVTLQIQLAAFRFLLDKNKNIEKNKIISSCYFFVMISSLFFALVIMIVFKHFNIITRTLISLYLILDTFIQLTRQICRGYSKNKKYVISSIVETFTNLFFIIILVVLMNLGLNGMLISLILSLLVSIIYLIIKLNIFSSLSFSNIDKYVLKDMLFYSLPLIFNTLSWHIVNTSDRIIITTFISVEINAIYAAANKIPSIYHLFYSTFNLAWQESASSSSDDSDVSNYYSSIFNNLFRVLFSGLIVLLSLTPMLVKILLNDSYYAALYQMPILYIALFFSSFASFYGGIYIAFKKTKSVGISSVISAILNIIINLLLINKIGLYAASFSTLISFFIMSIYRAIDLRKLISIKYDFKFMFFSIMIIPLFIGVCYINNFYVCIFSSIISFLLFVFFNKHLLTIVYNKIKNNIKIKK